jgi:CRP-like cAMP-binding protein
MAILPTPKQAVRRKSLPKGQALFRQGDETFAIFEVIKGQVRLLRYLPDGSSVCLYVAQAGDTFSEAALYSPRYHCDCIADLDSEIELHPKDALLTAFAKDPDAAQAFTAHLARQVINLRAHLELRNIRSARERVWQYLMLNAIDKNQRITFKRPLKDIAADIGLTHEAFYRALAELEKEGVISRNLRQVTLLSA